MPYLIDGNNVIGTIPIFDLQDPRAREKLSRLLSRYQKAKGNSIVVVYDGPPPDGSREELSLGRLHIIYAGPKSDADSVIKNKIREAKSPDQWTVVSTDKQVYSYCKWAGAKAMNARQFYDDIKRVLESSGDELVSSDMKSEDVEEWLDYFGIEETE